MSNKEACPHCDGSGKVCEACGEAGNDMRLSCSAMFRGKHRLVKCPDCDGKGLRKGAKL